jgi:hypothetical protein
MRRESFNFPPRLTTGLLGIFLWYRPGRCQCRFRKAIKPESGLNRQVFSGLRWIYRRPKKFYCPRQHNCLPSAMVRQARAERLIASVMKLRAAVARGEQRESFHRRFEHG